MIRTGQSCGVDNCGRNCTHYRIDLKALSLAAVVQSWERECDHNIHIWHSCCGVLCGNRVFQALRSRLAVRAISRNPSFDFFAISVSASLSKFWLAWLHSSQLLMHAMLHNEEWSLTLFEEGENSFPTLHAPGIPSFPSIHLCLSWRDFATQSWPPLARISDNGYSRNRWSFLPPWSTAFRSSRIIILFLPCHRKVNILLSNKWVVNINYTSKVSHN